MDEVGADIKKYVENDLMPKYAGVGGHTDKHIRQVITRSMRFAKQAPGVNLDMVYVIAAYHDLGRLVDDETHNIESAKMMRKDEFLKKHFSADEIKTMAEAVEDHRASLGREPRSVYGKIVSSADRNANVKVMLGRVYDYTKYLHPEMTEDEIIEEARIQLRKKYSPDGYAAKTMYFDDPKFAGALEEVERITRDFGTFAKAIHDNNQQRFKK